MQADHDDSMAIRVRDARVRLGVTEGMEVWFAAPSFELESGGQTALTGPSGCGKSTLLNILAGLLPVDEGDVRILGRDLRAMAPGELDRLRGGRIGLIPQNHSLFPQFTALENIEIALRFGRGVPRGQRRTRARELLLLMGLEHRAHFRIDNLSMGERQRAAAARALANRPGLILADEPTGALDLATARAVLGAIVTAARSENAALVFVTHDMELADMFPRRFDCRDLVQTRRAGQ